MIIILKKLSDFNTYQDMDSKNREWLGLQFQWSPNMWAKRNYINLLHIQHLQNRR